jgi:hypothetical protein
VRTDLPKSVRILRLKGIITRCGQSIAYDTSTRIAGQRSWHPRHKHPKVRQWLARHRRWTFHFTPTSASWLNAVESFFATLTQRRLKRGVFVLVVDLQEAINRFVIEHNAEPKPFTWTADPDKLSAPSDAGTKC